MEMMEDMRYSTLNCDPPAHELVLHQLVEADDEDIAFLPNVCCGVQCDLTNGPPALAFGWHPLLSMFNDVLI